MKKLAAVYSRAVSTNGYKALVKKIIQEFGDLEVLVKRSVARGHWKVGKYIDEHLLENKDKPGHATGFYEKLAEDTGRERTTLQSSVRFYRAYPNCDFNHNLTWNHVRGLLTVKDAQERKALEQKIAREEWDFQKFRKYLNVKRRLAAPGKDDQPVAQLTFTRGRLHTYRIVPANKSLSPVIALAMDFGFREQYEIPAAAPKLKENDTAEFVFRNGRLSGARKVTVAPDELFTYVAMVERVVDGDTLLVSFDFKCPMSVSQKLRLRGIDCPEMDTEEGRKAKRFVEARLKDCDFIVVKTYKDRSDKFDRYLADVFSAPGVSDPAVVAKEGTYLNQELLDEHLAVAYE